ncbi:FadR/GntR family transcriptional regulator [Pseudonocardia sp. CA-107938]|uniref:FadR/GntR family transcriptional regulator n=1 Tax=Pseudonocardia sp. CA-107938 TaxID=3240021 RepID=UPI003D8C959E
MSTDRDRTFELTLDAGRPLPDVIADKIRGLIDSGHYRPGGRLDNETELARNMKVARSSVRTALQRLETLELLEVKRGLGWYVRRTPPSTARPGLFEVGGYSAADLFELRIGLEGLAASLAAVRASAAEVELVRKWNTDFRHAGEDRDLLLEADEGFHLEIVKLSRNRLLLDTYVPIVERIREWRYDSYSGRGVPLRAAREHDKIIRYLNNDDPGGARAAMNSHLQRLYDELPDLVEEPLDSTESWSDAEPQWSGAAID